MQPSLGVTRRSQCLWHWRARDLSLTAVTGQVGSLTRATGGGMIVDRNGRLYPTVHSQPRWEAVDLDGDGARESVGLLLEPSRTQILPDPQTPNSWDSLGTPIITTGIVDPWGGTSAIMIEDDDGAAGEGKYETATVTGDGTKTAVVAVRAGTLSRVLAEWFDSTAGVERHQVQITWQAGSTPPALVTNAGAGTRYPPVAVFDRQGTLWWLIAFTATGVVAANLNRVRVRAFAADTGTVFLAGGNAFDAVCHGAWQSAAAQLRGADVFSFPPPSIVPVSMNVYFRFLMRGLTISDFEGVAQRRLFQITQSGNTDSLRIVTTAGLNLQALVNNGGVDLGASVNVNTAAVYNDLMEVRAYFPKNGASKIGRTINSGAELSSTGSVVVLPAAWQANATLMISHVSGVGNGGIVLIDAKAVAGPELSMPQLREVF